MPERERPPAPRPRRSQPPERERRPPEPDPLDDLQEDIEREERNLDTEEPPKQ